MPAGDGTGPCGWGAMTGRAAGYCAGFGVPGYMNPSVRGYGYGFGIQRWEPRYGGWGRGYGRRGWGFGRGFGRVGYGRRGRGFGRGYGWGFGRGVRFNAWGYYPYEAEPGVYVPYRYAPYPY